MKHHQPPFILREFKIEVTHRCPLACIHCSSDAGPTVPKEMTEEKCLRILDEAIEMGAEEVAFSGGEPLIWPTLKEALKNLEEKGEIYLKGAFKRKKTAQAQEIKSKLQEIRGEYGY